MVRYIWRARALWHFELIVAFVPPYSVRFPRMESPSVAAACRPSFDPGLPKGKAPRPARSLCARALACGHAHASAPLTVPPLHPILLPLLFIRPCLPERMRVRSTTPRCFEPGKNRKLAL